MNYDFTSTAYTITDDKTVFESVNTVHILDFFIENVAGTTEYAIVPNPNIAIYPWVAVHTNEERRNLFNATLENFSPTFPSAISGILTPNFPTYKVEIEGINYTVPNNPNIATVVRDGTAGKDLETIWRTNPLVGIISGQGQGSASINLTEYWNTTTNAFAASTIFVTVLIYVDYYINAF